MKTEQEIQELHMELTKEIHDPETTTQRKKYLQSAVEVISFILT